MSLRQAIAVGVGVFSLILLGSFLLGPTLFRSLPNPSGIPQSSTTADSSQVSAVDIVGSWTVEVGGSFSEITLSSDGTFFTFLHERPFTDGLWRYQGGVLLLDVSADQTFDQQFTDLARDGDILHMKMGGEDHVWKTTLSGNNIFLEENIPDTIGSVDIIATHVSNRELAPGVYQLGIDLIINKVEVNNRFVGDVIPVGGVFYEIVDIRLGDSSMGVITLSPEVGE